MKVLLAVQFLEGDVFNWWDVMTICQGNEGIPWAEFETVFWAWYVPQMMRVVKGKEFFELIKSPNMIVPQCQTNFEELGKYGEEYISTKEKKDIEVLESFVDKDFNSLSSSD